MGPEPAISGRSPSALNFGRDEVSDDSFTAMSPDRSLARLGQVPPLTSGGYAGP